jgi:alpha-glucosidase (family GH31 glycosyl hydrolase)
MLFAGTTNANITVHDEALHCSWSPFSTAGWHVIDDHNTTILDANDWVSNDTSASSTDLYFFGHGLSFKQALKDYVTVSGNHPLLPKFSMGVMWSRWYDLSFHDVRYLVEDGYGAHGIPLDL